MKSLFSLLIAIFFVACTAFGQSTAITKTGTTAASFLKIGVGARAIGMGGAYTAVSDDISALYWNPAGLGFATYGEAVFNHVDWILDTRFDFAAATLVIDGLGTIGASFSTMGVGDMYVTTTAMPEGTGEKFTAGATMFGLLFSKNLTDKFSIGFNVKYIRETVWNMSAQSVGIDVGTMYIAPVLNGLRIGASMANFGPKMRLEGRDNLVLVKTGAGGKNIINSAYELDSYDLPLIFRVGLATDAVKMDNNRLTVAVDAVHPNDNTEYVNSGIEYSWANIISLRAGWKSAYERGGEQGLTFGAGVQYEFSSPVEFLIDYAYQEFGRLKEVHYFSVGLRF
ncbi:MAG: PorV/PorQ family protein [Bacteroidota bacterium]